MKIATLIALSTLCITSAQAQDMKPGSVARPNIKQVALSSKDIADVQAVLKEMNPASYNVQINQAGKAPVRLGNAAIKDLSTVSVFHGVGTRPSAANEIVTNVDNYVRVVWTSSVAGADKARMEKVNSILSKGAN